MDPEIRNELWDARVKIVYGRFIINTLSFIFGYLFVGIIVMNLAFKGNEDAARFIVLLGLFLAFIVFAVSFFVDFKPKMAKINTLLEHLSLHKVKRIEYNMPMDALVVRSFINNDVYEVKKDVLYYAWIKEQSLCLFPYKPTIEDLHIYVEYQVPYVLIEIPDVNSFSLKQSSQMTYTHNLYQNKRLFTESVTSNTVKVQFSNQSFCIFDDRINALFEKEIQESEVKSQQASSNQSSLQKDNVKEKLAKLKELFEQNLISDEEYQKKRKELIDKL